MPELPEVEITVRRLDAALRGAEIESALAPGINALKTFAPPLEALAGLRIDGVRRRGKQIIVEAGGKLALLMHLMSAGRLQLYDSRAGLRDRTSRLLVRVADGRELRLREFGTKQAAWVKLLELDALAGEESLTRLVPRPGRSRPPTSASDSASRDRCMRRCAISTSSPASGARGSMRSSGRRGSRPSSAALTSTRRSSRSSRRRSSRRSGARSSTTSR